MVKYPMRGGLVPRGARHPHAGTGFGINQAFAWPINERRMFGQYSS